MKHYFFVFSLFLLLSVTIAHAADDVVFADFEGKNYGSWKVEGTAFGDGPAQGTLKNQMKVDGYLGKGLVNSFNGGDDSTGRLTSTAFEIDHNFITFLIGGGGWKNETCMNLLIDGKVVRTATGPNTQAGGTDPALGVLAKKDVAAIGGPGRAGDSRVCHCGWLGGLQSVLGKCDVEWAGVGGEEVRELTIRTAYLYVTSTETSWCPRKLHTLLYVKT